MPSTVSEIVFVADEMLSMLIGRHSDSLLASEMVGDISWDFKSEILSFLEIRMP